MAKLVQSEAELTNTLKVYAGQVYCPTCSYCHCLPTHSFEMPCILVQLHVAEVTFTLAVALHKMPPTLAASQQHFQRLCYAVRVIVTDDMLGSSFHLRDSIPHCYTKTCRQQRGRGRDVIGEVLELLAAVTRHKP